VGRLRRRLIGLGLLLVLVLPAAVRGEPAERLSPEDEALLDDIELLMLLELLEEWEMIENASTPAAEPEAEEEP
jgi:hypothetical protein